MREGGAALRSANASPARAAPGRPPEHPRANHPTQRGCDSGSAAQTCHAQCGRCGGAAVAAHQRGGGRPAVVASLPPAAVTAAAEAPLPPARGTFGPMAYAGLPLRVSAMGKEVVRRRINNLLLAAAAAAATAATYTALGAIAFGTAGRASPTLFLAHDGGGAVRIAGSPSAGDKPRGQTAWTTIES